MRTVRWLGAFGLGLAALTVAPAGAQSKPRTRPLAASDIVSLWRVSDPQIAPDGSRVAFVVTAPGEDGRPRPRLWLASDGGSAPRELPTDGPASAPRWLPDGRSLVFLTSGLAAGQGRIARLVLESQAVEVLATVDGALRDARVSPDGSALAFLKADPETPEEAERRGRGDDAWVAGEGHKHSRLYRLDLRGRAVQALTKADETVWRFSWSREGTRIAYLASELPTAEGQEYRSGLFVLDVADGRVRRVAGDTNPHAAPAFSPDGRGLAYLGPVGRLKERGVVKVTPLDGGPTVERLREEPLNVWDVAWLPSGAGLLAGIQRGTRHALAVLSGDAPPRDVVALDFSLTPYWDPSFTLSADGRRVAFLSEADQHLEEVFVAALDGGGQRRRLTSFGDRLAGLTLGRVEPVRWTNGADGASVEGVLVHPPAPAAGAAPRPLPMVTLLHGGPAYGWGLGAQVRNWAQLLAGQGYLVFLPNFRGSAGYGMPWMTANVRDWGAGPLGDVLSGVDHLVGQGQADPRRLFVGGGSYGGYLTAWAVTHTDRFRAAYVASGLSSLGSAYALTDEPSFLAGYFGATPYDDPEVYRHHSPVAHAASAHTPTLIVHGEKDLRVPVSQAHELHAALRHHGVRCGLVIYPREGHGIREPGHQLDFMRRVLDWFRENDVGDPRRPPP